MPDQPSPQPIDPERRRGANAFDQPHGYSGQGYTIGREIAEGAARADPVSPATDDGGDLPPDAGHRAGVDRATGAVHGSGAGAGGGSRGESYGFMSGDSDALADDKGGTDSTAPPDRC